MDQVLAGELIFWFHTITAETLTSRKRREKWGTRSGLAAELCSACPGLRPGPTHPGPTQSPEPHWGRKTTNSWPGD